MGQFDPIWGVGASRGDLESEKAARLIKKIGDDAAHTCPGIEPDMEELLKAMTCVLEALAS